MKIRAVSVRAWELFAADGTTLGLYVVEDEWRGMQSLRSVDPPERRVIVDTTGDGLGGVFAAMFGEHRADLTVVKASPDLHDILNAGGQPA